MAAPSRLGRYELRHVLGRGAMGVVYEGFDPSLGRKVAIKTILKSHAFDEETARSYVRAHMWFSLGAASGHAEAVKNRDIVAKGMTPQQIAEAQGMARGCQQRKFKGCD